MTAQFNDEPKCDLCGEGEVIVLNGRCHIMAPLKAELHKGILTLRCYIPECGREIVRFKVEPPPDE